MLKMNDTHTILLSSASRRDSGSLYPLPGGRSAGARIATAIDALLADGLIAERETNDTADISRNDGDICYGLFITSAGKAAIGVEDELPGLAGAAEHGITPSPLASPRGTKTAEITALLKREQGATLGELIAATDWLPHTTRAALTGLRKKGHTIERGKRDDATCYRIAAAL